MRNTVALNTEAVVQELAKQFNERFDDAVQKPVDGLRSDLEGFVREMDALGAEKASEVRRDVATLMSEFNDARRQIKAIERRALSVSSRLPCSAATLRCDHPVGGLVIYEMVGWKRRTKTKLCLAVPSCHGRR